MSRPRLATMVHELRGSYRKDPQRRKGREQEPETLKLDPKPPEHLTAGQAACWSEVLGLLAAGVAQESDRLTVEIVAVLFDEFRQDPKNFPTSRLTRLQTALGTLGMTPSDRSRVIVPKQERNEFDDL